MAKFGSPRSSSAGDAHEFHREVGVVGVKDAQIDVLEPVLATVGVLVHVTNERLVVQGRRE